MSGYLGQGRYGGFGGANVLLDLANVGRGEQDTLALENAKLQQNRLRQMMDDAAMGRQRDQSFRALAPRIAQGDQGAYQEALGIDPEAALKLRASLGAMGDADRNRAMTNVKLLSDVAASFLGMPDDQAAAAYPAAVERLRAAGVNTSGFPAQYPGQAVIRQAASMFAPVGQLLERENNRPRAQPGTSYEDRLIGMESGGDPNARNPMSSATGLGQFIDGTWLEYAAANPDRFRGMSRDQILAARSDPAMARDAVAWYRRQNEPKLAAAGVPVTDATAGLAHFLGPDGAARVLNAQPATPLAQVLPENVMRANPRLANQTAGDLVTTYNNRFAAAPMVDGSGRPIVNGDTVLVQGPNGMEYRPNQASIDAKRQIAQGKQDAKPPSPSEQKMDDADISAIQTASTLATDIATLSEMIKAGRFSPGLWSRWQYRLGDALDMSGPEGREFASFKATLERIRNDSLRLNSGVQTEGDAIRAGNELLSSINDKETVQKRLEEMVALNERAVALRMMNLNRRRAENKRDPIKLDEITSDRRVLGADNIAPQQQRERTAVNPQTGARIRLDPATNQWVPMQ